MIALIVAIGQDNCIGVKNKLPWHLPEDLKHFQEITRKKTVLMGQATFESILGYLNKPLPNRKNVILTFDKNYQAPEGVSVFHSIETALDAHKNEDVFFIGGASIYKQAMDIVDTLYITHVHRETPSCDAWFSEISPEVWNEVEREDHKEFSFVTYKRVQGS
jgi:dihydrofolate reductase